ncbi:MAG: isoprenylcysteine carboxylmethyltransferase family protein [Candidatus Omnitrophica bacterium]|nr:isoprenylcysteine carboxylmethyltransferase family protein [Candidatus Omnitrophota bacterium]
MSEDITLRHMWKTIFKREFYIDMAVFVFVCIPAVLVILFFSSKMDRALDLKPIISYPLNVVFFIILSLTGALIIWRAYTYLVFVGEGSPCPQLGGTKKLVTTGPYSLIRHPSVIGKLCGVIGLGLLSRSPFFTFAVIPSLFVWSAFYNRFIQEKGCEDKFGGAYLEYRKRVPMFIPKLRKR